MCQLRWNKSSGSWEKFENIKKNLQADEQTDGWQTTRDQNSSNELLAKMSLKTDFKLL